MGKKGDEALTPIGNLSAGAHGPIVYLDIRLSQSSYCQRILIALHKTSITSLDYTKIAANVTVFYILSAVLFKVKQRGLVALPEFQNQHSQILL